MNNTKRNYKIEKGIIGTAKGCNCYKIMLDKSDCKVWVDEFTNSSSWAQYDSDTIVTLYSGTGDASIYGWSKITLQDIKTLADEQMLNN